MTNNSEDVETSINHQLVSLHQSPSNPCIRKVPDYMAGGCFKPLVVSIGPLYCNEEALKSFHEMKLRHLKSLLDCADKDFTLGQFIEYIRGQEDEIRSYYSEKSSLSSNEFIEMILIDAAFIIMLFMQGSVLFYGRRPLMKDRVELKSKVNQDLFLVENQLPFFVLYDIFDKAFGVAYSRTTFKDVTFLFIADSFLGGKGDARFGREKIMEASNIMHLVDCLRIYYLPTKPRDGRLPLNVPLEFPKTIKELKAAGVKFIESESRRLLDITFSNGVLQIPTIKVQDTTKACLSSIAFFEQCHHLYDSYVIDYLCIMDAFIDTPEDVQILVQNKIITNFMGSDEEVATLFNKVNNKDVLMCSTHFYYAHLCQELNAYSNTKWNKWKAILRRDYFNHPWSILSLIYLLVLLILTTLQVYTGFKA